MTSTAHDRTQSPPKNAGVQFLRAVAVLGVIVFHLNDEWLRGGFVGVDVFFVISGFVITQSLLRNRTARLGNFLGGFYARRILRIVPALFVFLAVTALFVALFVPRGFFLGGDGPRTGMWAVFGLSNFSLYFSDRGYFDERIAFNAYSHTWSLGVEEQFYLVFPLLLWLSLSVVARRSLKGAPWLGFLVLAVPSFLSLLWSMSETSRDPQAAFYLLPSRFWELGVGTLLAYALALKLLRPAGKRSVFLAQLLGAGAVGFAFLTTNPEAFPFPGAIPAVVGTALLIYAFYQPADRGRGVVDQIVGWKPFQVLGDWSYSLYLWHWGVIVALRWTIGLEYWWHYLLAVALTLVLAGASYRFVEQPVLQQKLHERYGPIRLLSFGGITATVWLGSLWLGDRATEPLISRSVTANGEIFQPPDGVADPELEYAGLGGIGERQSVFVVGDSHSGHFGTLLTETRAVMEYDYRVIDDRDCPVVSLVAPRGDCDGYLEVVDIIKADAKPGDIVIFSSLRTPRISEIVDGQTESVSEVLSQYLEQITPEVRDAALTEARAVLSDVRTTGVVIVIPSPTPVFPSPVFRCLDWFNEHNPACLGGFAIDRDTMVALAEPANDAISALAEEGLVEPWQMFELLCPETECVTDHRGKHLFYDGDHLSAWGNYLLMPSFFELTQSVWAEDR